MQKLSNFSNLVLLKTKFLTKMPKPIRFNVDSLKLKCITVRHEHDSKYLQAYIISVNPITEVKTMAEVQAVKDLDKVKLISHLLERRYSKQMADVWNVGLNLALRISDLLSVKFNDIHDDRLLIKESKTGKLANIQLNQKKPMGSDSIDTLLISKRIT